SEDSRLLATDYDQVTEDVATVLGKNYLDHQDYTLLPGQFKYLPPVKLDAEVRYIGVIARYAEPDKAEWRNVIKVKNTGRHYQILVHLRQDEVELQKEEEYPCRAEIGSSGVKGCSLSPIISSSSNGIRITCCMLA
ncbi:type VI secretion system lipoprotein TssJ, partial [Plesiomonas shigelloides]|nr:type VI secretion system lipoprotein TssJ [Plesiomonas shigelloides]